jgi:endonuclease YncB( thermonuclease family)
MAGKQRKKACREMTFFGAVAVGVFSLTMVATSPAIHTYVGAAFAEAPNGADTCRFVSVHDGDTIQCGTERVRLLDIDAPELPGSPRCEGYRAARSWCDFDLGYKSRDALRAFLRQGPVGIKRQDKDKYGRTLAVVEVNGQSAGQYLISQGLARPWR